MATTDHSSMSRSSTLIAALAAVATALAPALAAALAAAGRGGCLYARMGWGGGPDRAARGMAGGMGARGAAQPPGRPVAIGPAEFQAFEQTLRDVQAAWSAQDLNALRAIASPEM